MQVFSSLSLFFIIAFWFHSIEGQEFEQGGCNLWGDPHLTMFPVSSGQQNLRMMYYCQSQGRMTVLKNKYIEIYVNTTEAPHWTEYIEIRFLAGGNTICTITNENSTCNNILLSVSKIGSGLEIQYLDADFLTVTFNSFYQYNGRNVYDLTIYLSYPIILESSGLCVNKIPLCRLENSVSPFGRRRKRDASQDFANRVCDAYMIQAYKTAKGLVNNVGSPMAEHARAACITDVSRTNSTVWGQSAVAYVVMDAMKQAGLSPIQRREKLQQAIPAIRRAALAAEGVIGDSPTTTIPTRPPKPLGPVVLE